MSNFFSFDGIDGGGKSTQIERFARWLRERGRDVVVCRDPGGTPLGEAVRQILLDHGEFAIGARCEMLLYMASRAQLVEEVIRPALEAGRTVVSDRFLLANVVYQGYGGGLDIDALWQVGEVATGGLQPDATIVLDLPAEDALQRLGRAQDRVEARGAEYLERVRRGFLDEAARRNNVIVVDASGDADAIEDQIRARVVATVGRID